ncbi:MAG: tetratricopeptide repeat protein [Nitrospirae bacterium]|nr:tetratricopeptide repeat protein [Nitrospirota bacterium]
MSLLADLLSKIKQPQSKRDVPPNLKSIVESSAKRSANRRRIILLSVLFAVAIITGVFFVSFVNKLSEKSVSNINVATQRRMTTSPADQNNPAPPAGAGLKPAREAQLPESAGAEQGKEVSKPAVVSKKQEAAMPRPLEKKAGEILPNLQQVIVKKEGPASSKGKSLNESGEDFYLYSAREHEAAKDYSKALMNYKKALEIDRDNVAVINNIAYILLEMNAFDEAVRYCQMALEINKDYVPALINLGIASARSGNISAAEENFNHALRIEPNNQTAVLNLALLYEKQTDHEKAAEYFSQLSRSGDVSGTLGLARVYERQGKTDDALKLYRNAYAIGPLDDRTRAEVKQRIMLLQNSR